MTDNYLRARGAVPGNYFDPWAWRSDMDAPRIEGALKQGPAPSGHDKVFDAAYGWLGGLPQNRPAASALAGLFDAGTLGMATGAYDGARELATTGRPGALAMALMPGARVGKAGFRAFHASPYVFDKFDLSHIGKGNGYGAFGQGINLSSTERGAQSYGPHRYEVSVNAPLEGFLNWDEALANQPESVRKAVASILPGDTIPGDWTGQTAAVVSGPFEELRERLMAAGLPGVRHQMPGGEGYVVFDDKMVDIVRRYGGGR